MDINQDLYSNPADDSNDMPSGATKEVVISEILAERDIIIKLVRCKSNDAPVYFGVWMVVNPRLFLGDNTYVGTFDISRVNELIDKLYLELTGVGIGHL